MKTHEKNNGQGMTEFLIVIPLLLLMAAGMVQFYLLFAARSSFEHACGTAARYYAAGEIEPKDFASEAWDDLGDDQHFFIPGTLRAFPIAATSSLTSLFTNRMNIFGPLLSKLKDYALNYTGQKWLVSIQYRGSPFFGYLFHNGLCLETQLAVMRYPEAP